MRRSSRPATSSRPYWRAHDPGAPPPQPVLEVARLGRQLQGPGALEHRNGAVPVDFQPDLAVHGDSFVRGGDGQMALVSRSRFHSAGNETPSSKATYSGSMTCGAHLRLNASWVRAG